LIPLLLILHQVIFVLNDFVVSQYSIRLSGYIVLLQEWLVIANVAVSTFSPVVIYHDRKFLAEYTNWRPNILYVISFIPLVNVLIVSVYLIRRRRAIERVSP
jgi:hypothetical protein